MSPIPYISRTARPGVRKSGADNTGELTFLLTDLVLEFLGPEPHFEDFAAAVAALECTKLELYRRSVAPYENTKVKQNGDLPYPYARPVQGTVTWKLHSDRSASYGVPGFDHVRMEFHDHFPGGKPFWHYHDSEGRAVKEPGC